jgi:arylformamidase
MKIIDLTYPIYQGMFKFWGDWHCAVEVEPTALYDRDRCSVHKLVLATHTGTHVDAPRHFFAEGMPIDRVALDRLVTDAVVYHLRDKGPQSRITLADVDLERIAPGETALLNTGWYRHWDGDFYQDFPVMDEEVAQAFVDRGAAALAVDIPLMPVVHGIVLGAGRLLIENLTNLDEITTERVQLIALPLKFRDGDGAPARVVAVQRG